MFIKNDQSFICIHCGQKVPKLCYTSRDHCNHCLYSLHVDIMPGDRANCCLGELIPTNVIQDAKKGKIIEYQCSKCGATLKNIVAADDNRQAIYDVVSLYSTGIKRKK